jgi:hypothetical protein
LLEEPSEEYDAVRIAPDPIAEHLVARARCETCKSNYMEWVAFLRELCAIPGQRGGGVPEGFIEALASCGEHPAYGQHTLPGRIHLDRMRSFAALQSSQCLYDKAAATALAR